MTPKIPTNSLKAGVRNSKRSRSSRLPRNLDWRSAGLDMRRRDTARVRGRCWKALCQWNLFWRGGTRQPCEMEGTWKFRILSEETLRTGGIRSEETDLASVGDSTTLEMHFWVCNGRSGEANRGEHAGAARLSYELAWADLSAELPFMGVGMDRLSLNAGSAELR
ncbi:hypothetical protein K474DRAFT_1330829 [Panus rudis PR-1116 ss-1]|nr:hypothetical protein K474DRAFT_1330829 [Panus rudis PR-1116 ss-1]